MLMAALAVSCAPTTRAPAQLDVASVRARYERARAARAARLVAVRLEATAWLEGDKIGRWPAFQLDLALAGPDAVRARVASLFGTALDLAVRGDSLRAYFPPRRIGLEVNALEESLGVSAPGRWVCRALAADWRPDDSGWSSPSGDSLKRVEWTEDVGTLAMTVGSSGLPHTVELRDRYGRVLRARYLGWLTVDRVPWPDRLELEEGDGAFLASIRVDRARFPASSDPHWFAVDIPSRATRVDWSSLRRALERLGDRE
jgi:hypothetical protein